MFKNMRLVILFEIFLNPSFKMMTNFANIVRTTPSTSKLNTRKDYKSSGTGSLYEKKILILNELKTNLKLKFSLQKSLQSFDMVWKVAD